MVGEIPQSKALDEASGDSLAELFSRDPEGLTKRDEDRIVAELRAMRQRWVQAEASGAKRAPKEKVTSTPAGAEDLGL